MSFDAIRWALAQPVPKSSAKFVLVAMADCVNAESTERVCWPSVAALVDATAQDRKTVMEGMRKLREQGFIEDTGEKRGRTAQVSVYRLKSPEIGTVQKSESHYTYRLTDPQSGDFYVGVRSCVGAADRDTKYLGSGRWCSLRRPSQPKLLKEILATHESRDAAEAAEQLLLDQFFGTPGCRNLARNTSTNRPKSGTAYTGEAVPDFPPNSTEIPPKQYQISPETVPKAVHGISNGISNGTKKEPVKKAADAAVIVLEIPGVSAQLFADWMVARKAKNAGKLTTTAVSGLVREAGRAGLSLEQAVTVCCEANWINFNAGWYQKREGIAQPRTTPGRHSGFEKLNYSEGIEADGSFH